jgi:WD40 repeat protein
MIVVQGRYIYTASADHTIKAWRNKKKREALVTLEGHTDAVLILEDLDH